MLQAITKKKIGEGSEQTRFDLGEFARSNRFEVRLKPSGYYYITDAYFVFCDTR